MARTKRICPAREVFHVLNRAVARLTIFEKPEDYAAFMRVVEETWEIVPLPVYAMVAMPNHWQWSSAHARRQRAEERRWLAIPGDPPLPRNWRSWVNKMETEAELTSLRRSVKRGVPFGDDQWTRSSAVRLCLETTTRPRGRPKKET